MSHAQYITVALPKIIEQAETLCSLGHQTTLAVTSKTNRFRTERFERNGVRYVISPSVLHGRWRHGADPYDAIRRYIALRGESFDIVHAIDSRPSVILPALALQRTLNIPLVIEWSDWYGRGGAIEERSGRVFAHTFGVVEAFFEEHFRLRADAATAISARLRDRLIGLGFPPEKILLHRMGCRTDIFDRRNSRSAKIELGLNPDQVYFGYFGRLYEADHRFLLSAFEAACDDLGAQLLFVGDVKPLASEKLAQIHYVGRVSDETYRTYLNAVDVCLLPLRATQTNLARWPSKVGDYLAAGKPVVATPVSDVAEIFADSKIGILSSDTTPAGYAQALRRIVAHKSRWKEMGDNGRQFARQHLDWSVIARTLIRFYENTIASRK